MATRLEVIAGGGLDREGVSFFIFFSKRMKKERGKRLEKGFKSSVCFFEKRGI